MTHIRMNKRKTATEIVIGPVGRPKRALPGMKRNRQERAWALNVMLRRQERGQSIPDRANRTL